MPQKTNGCVGGTKMLIAMQKKQIQKVGDEAINKVVPLSRKTNMSEKPGTRDGVGRRELLVKEESNMRFDTRPVS